MQVHLNRSKVSPLPSEISSNFLVECKRQKHTMHSSTATAMTIHIAACHFFNNGEKFLLRCSNLYMLTACQNKICCKRACCFPDIKSPLQSQTGVRENVLTRSFKDNRGFRDFQFQFYLTFSITLDISRVFEVGSQPLNPGWVIVFCTSENSTPQCLSPPRNINSLNWYL